ncbi:MAG: response regulator [Vicinamibacterales bacterium]
MNAAIRIVIAEDHPFFLSGLRQALDREPGFQVVAETGDGRAALEAIRTLAPDVAILDIGLPVMDGCAVVKAVRQARLPVEIAFLTIADDGALFEQALEWDVKGYLLKDCTDVDIVRCVRAIAQGQHFACPTMTTYLVNKTRRIERFTGEAPGLKRLTRQEQAILSLIARDMTSKDIARELGIAQKTVEAHRSNICRKLELHGNHALSRFAIRHRDEI